MGWEWYDESSGKPYIYNYNKKQDSYSKSHAGFFSWQTGSLWNSYDECIKYTNTEGQSLKLNSVSIKSLACNSGGQSYWSTTGIVGTPCTGVGGYYYCYVRKIDSSGNPVESSDKTKTVRVEKSEFNMNTPGTGTDISQTARFGYPPLPGPEYVEYPIIDCPIIGPGEGFYLHFGMASFDTTNLMEANIRFFLKPGDMEIDIKPADTPVIWRFEEDGKWHLVNRLYQYTSNGWNNLTKE